MRYAYPCILTPEPEGGFFAQFPDVRGALTGGKDRAETLAMAQDALGVIFGAFVKNDEDVPQPSPLAEGQYLVPVPLLIAAKLSLYTALREQQISHAELAGRLGITETAVANLVNPDYGSHLTTVMRALYAVGRRLIVEDVPALTEQEVN